MKIAYYLTPIVSASIFCWLVILYLVAKKAIRRINAYVDANDRYFDFRVFCKLMLLPAVTLTAIIGVLVYICTHITVEN